MANFNTHLAVASVGSGLCATVALAGHAAPNNYLLTLTLAGAIGGILPDIDLEKAHPSRMLFSALGVIFAFVALFSFKKQYSIAELWIVWLSIYLFVRYAIFAIFHRRTHHRGIFHSILAGAFFMTLTAAVFERVLEEPASSSWLTGFFLLIGYLIHLVLDEIYSVDIEGATLKRSFGSALKLFDYKSARASIGMALAFSLALAMAPPLTEFEQMIRAPVLFAFLKDKMLPKGRWFEERMVSAASAADDEATKQTP